MRLGGVERSHTRRELRELPQGVSHLCHIEARGEVRPRTTETLRRGEPAVATASRPGVDDAALAVQRRPYQLSSAAEPLAERLLAHLAHLGTGRTRELQDLSDDVGQAVVPIQALEESASAAQQHLAQVHTVFAALHRGRLETALEVRLEGVKRQQRLSRHSRLKSRMTRPATRRAQLVSVASPR